MASFLRIKWQMVRASALTYCVIVNHILLFIYILLAVVFVLLRGLPRNFLLIRFTRILCGLVNGVSVPFRDVFAMFVCNF